MLKPPMTPPPLLRPSTPTPTVAMNKPRAQSQPPETPRPQLPMMAAHPRPVADFTQMSQALQPHLNLQPNVQKKPDFEAVSKMYRPPLKAVIPHAPLEHKPSPQALTAQPPVYKQMYQESTKTEIETVMQTRLSFEDLRNKGCADETMPKSHALEPARPFRSVRPPVPTTSNGPSPQDSYANAMPYDLHQRSRSQPPVMSRSLDELPPLAVPIDGERNMHPRVSYDGCFELTLDLGDMYQNSPRGSSLPPPGQRKQAVPPAAQDLTLEDHTFRLPVLRHVERELTPERCSLQ